MKVFCERCGNAHDESICCKESYADLPEAGASAERISSVIYSPAMTVEFNCKKCGEKVVREKVSEDAMKIGYYKRLFKWCDKCRREWERSALKRLPVVLDAIGRDCI